MTCNHPFQCYMKSQKYYRLSQRTYWLINPQTTEKMEKNKQELLQEQSNKIDEIIKVLTENFGEDFVDEVNYLEIVKGKINTEIN